jgi:hypothetical protein
MGLKLTIRDTDQEEEEQYQPAQPVYMQPMQTMYPVQQAYPMQTHRPRAPKAQSRSFTETVTRHLMTDDPMVKLSDHAKSKGMDISPVLIAGALGAVAWVMFKDALVVGGIVAAAYWVLIASKKKTGE